MEKIYAASFKAFQIATTFLDRVINDSRLADPRFEGEKMLTSTQGNSSAPGRFRLWIGLFVRSALCCSAGYLYAIDRFRGSVVALLRSRRAVPTG